MGLTSTLGGEGDSASDRERARRVAPIGGGVGGALGAALGVVLAGSVVEVALLAGTGAALTVLFVWLLLTVLS